ncbi:MAG: hypothetical protein ACHQ17_00315 [Polyangia bacterium]|jgi:cytochrome c biogenesis factor
MASTPYRSGDDAPRYVCIVCFGEISIGPGACSRCGAPLSSLDALEVVTAVRNRAMNVRAKLNRQKNVTVIVPAVLISVVLFFVLIAAGIPLDYSSNTVGGGSVFMPYFLVSIPIWAVVFVSVYPRVFRQTQARLKFDPVNADLPGVLEWLGLRVEGGKARR